MTTIIYVGKAFFEMPGATSVAYAAKRVAEGKGYDPDDPVLQFNLGLPDGSHLPEEDVIADYDECHLVLFVSKREVL